MRSSWATGGSEDNLFCSSLPASAGCRDSWWSLSYEPITSTAVSPAYSFYVLPSVGAPQSSPAFSLATSHWIQNPYGGYKIIPSEDPKFPFTHHAHLVIPDICLSSGGGGGVVPILPWVEGRAMAAHPTVHRTDFHDSSECQDG